MKEFKKIFLILTVILLGELAYGQVPQEWEAYKKHFISPDGRIIDFQQGQISHSEGQGYGLLMAVMYEDFSAFSQIWKWTQENLRVRKRDSLHAWKWGLRPNGQWSVLDYNNATDGDILIAWSLLKAAQKEKKEDYRNQAREIIRSIRENLVVNRRNKSFLLPGYYGFSLKEGDVLNPSYLVFSGLKEFGQVEEADFWKRVYEDSLEILKRSTFGRLGLPADWVLVNESGVSIYSEKSRFFSYEAIRILLYLSWNGNLKVLPGSKSLLDMYQKLRYVPLNVDLVMNNISLEEGPGGYYALYSRVARDLGDGDLSRSLLQRAAKKLQGEKDDYYSHTLYLLSQGGFKP
jgi:endoglucanase